MYAGGQSSIMLDNSTIQDLLNQMYGYDKLCRIDCISCCIGLHLGLYQVSNEALAVHRLVQNDCCHILGRYHPKKT